jgi:hypothetical protein
MAGDDDAYFPKPRAKGGYREPADAPRVHELEDAGAEAGAEPPKRVVVVTRAQEPLEAERRRVVDDASAESLRTVMRKERAYWDRYSALRNHPRKIGGLLAGLGGALVWGELATNGGLYTKAGFIGPLAFTTGLFLLVFGMPVDANGLPTDSWKTRFGIAIGLGIVLGMLVVGVIAH